jgi:hypothetical protein
MPHSQGLRAIGQSLELAQIQLFELQKQGQFYLIRCPLLTPAHHRMIKDSLLEGFRDDLSPAAETYAPSSSEATGEWLRYDSRMISCLNGQGQKKRRHYLAAAAQTTHRTSQYLRTLGEHLDRAGARRFTIAWDYPAGVTVSYQSPDDRTEQSSFSFDRLQELGLTMKYRRSTRNA